MDNDMTLPDIPERIIDLLAEGGLTSVEAILAAGREGLEGISGIGPKTAEAILEAAADMSAASASAGAETEQPAPESGLNNLDNAGPDHNQVWVRLAGKAKAVVAGRFLNVGEARQVKHWQLREAVSRYPAGTFEFKRPGETYRVAE